MNPIQLDPRFAALSPEKRALVLRRLEMAAAAGVAARPIRRAAGDGPFPLSFAQRRLWILSELEGPAATYNIAAAVQLTGPLNRFALEQSVGELIRRHEALRTRFVRDPVGEVGQCIVPIEEAGNALEVELATAEEIAGRMSARARTPFDLERGAPARFVLFQTAADSHVFLLVVHHLVADGWSMGLIVRELAALYRGFSAALAPALFELPVRYVDYAVWETQAFDRALLAPLIEYWHDALRDAPETIDLLTDRPRPARATYRGGAVRLDAEASVVRAVRGVCEEEGASAFAGALASLSILLSRYTDQHDIVVGCPFANRPRPETAGIVGFFVNTLPVRVRLDDSSTFRDAVRRAQQSIAGAIEHQTLPFERLVDELQPDRTTGRSPIYQVVLAYQPSETAALDLPGIDVTLVAAETRTAKFELTFLVEETASGWRVSAEFNADLFDESTVRRMIEHWRTLMASAGARPDVPVNDLEMMSRRERQLVAEEWPGASDLAPIEQTVPELFAAVAASMSDRIALMWDGGAMRYDALARRAEAIAASLRASGIGRGALVGVQAGRTPEMVAALLGILQAGAGYVPLDRDEPPARHAHVASETGIPLILTDAIDGSEIAGVPLVPICTLWDADADLVPVEPGILTPDDVAYVMYTSGSTGRPKGARIAHRGIVRLVHGQNYVKLGPDETVLQFAPIGFDAATFEIWGALLNGARLVLAPASPSLAELGAVIRRERVTTAWLTASLFQLMVEEQLEDLSGVRQLLAGGDVLSPPHVAKAIAGPRAGCVINGYGPTENTTFTCCHTVTSTDGAIPIGRPIRGTTVYVLDDRRRPVPMGVAGNLHTGGHGLAIDYLNQPELTADRFVPNPFGTGRLYRTGDRARWRSDGTLEFLGRLDAQLKIRGFRVEPGEVEAVLAQSPAVKRAVAIARDGVRSPELVAYVVPSGSHGDDAALSAVLMEDLRASLPAYMVPAGVVLLSELPLTPNGKLDRRALPALARPSGPARDVRPATPTERQVAAIFQEVLGISDVCVTDNFFELGGNSLVATQLVSRVRRDLGIALPLRAVFETPDVAGLARACEAAGSSTRGQRAADLIPAVDRATSMPLSFAQERLWFLHRLEPDNPFYNVAIALEIDGRLEVDALARALQAIAARHEVLRTSYQQEDGRPIQIVKDAARLPLACVDLGERADRREEVGRLAREEARKPFDLSAGPIARATLVRLGDTEHVLLLTIHHIAADGWSMGVLVRELMAFYRGQELPPLPIQYADFAAWQRQRLAGDELALQSDYWMRQFEQLPGELTLPTDRQRPPVQSFQGGSIRFDIDRATLARLHTLCRETDATLFMVLLSSFAAVLARHADQEDLVIGSPIANRTRTDLEPLIGFFVNTLALRMDVSGTPTFREIVQRVRQTALGAYAHQDLPFERLVDQVHPTRDLSRNPLFQVMFALQNAPVPVLDLPGLRVSPMDLGRTTAQFDLVLDMWEGDSGLVGVLEFSVDLFDIETAARLVEHFTTLAAGAAANPDCRLTDLPLLPPAEHRIVREFSTGESAPFPLDRTLPGLFEDQARAAPGRTAVECNGRTLTYAELNARANRIAHRLRRLGIARNEFVGIMLDRSEHMSVAIAGVLKAGGAYVPIDTTYPIGRINHMLADSGVRVVITQGEAASAVDDRAWPDVEWLRVDADALEGESDSNPAPINAPSDRAYMLYTSGSTGIPKGAIIRHDGKINHIYAQFRALAFHADSAFLQTAPVSSDISVWQYLGPLLIGGRTVIADQDTVCDPAGLWKLMIASRVTIAELVPVALSALLDHANTLPPAERRLEHLEWMMATGEGVPPSLVNRWLETFPAIPIVNAYGPTEAADDVTQEVIRTPLPAGTRSVSIGRPLANLSVYVLDPALNFSPLGVPGEICVAGIGVGEGYWRDAARTSDRFVSNPHRAGEHDAVLYRTGDIGVWRRDGRLECLSRVDEQVKIRGFRIELGEIEAALSTHPAVSQAVVVAREDSAQAEKSLAAYVVPNLSATEVDREVRQIRADQVTLWQELHDDEYRQQLDYGDPTFNVIGWDSTYTGLPLPIEEMREYIDGTVARILDANPRRLLEIGCGTGLIMFRLLPHLESYVGLDLSKTAIERLRELQQSPDRPAIAGFDRATLIHGPATDLSALEPGSIDTVVFPSVLQYFPGLDYVLDVIDRVMRVLSPDGTIVFADVRSVPVLGLFHTSVAVARAEADATAQAVRERIAALEQGEQELAIDPEFFSALKRRHARIRDVVVAPKVGRLQNEMTRFRYDVTIRCADVSRQAASTWTPASEIGSLDRLRARVQAESGDVFCVAQLPNSRLAEAAALRHVLATAAAERTLESARQAIDAMPVKGFEPEDLRQLGAELGFDVYLSMARSDDAGRFDAAFVRRGGAQPRFPEPDTSLPWLAYANNPLHERLAAVFAPRLRDYLKQRVPHYMVPPALVMLGRLPTTPAGKIDRRALPAPCRISAAADVVAPRDRVEATLAQIWCEVLGLESCGVTQSFFEVGGHSLKATQVVSRVKMRLGIDLPLRTVFTHPTIEEFARLVSAGGAEAPAASAASIAGTLEADHYPLSHAQRRLWLLSQFDDASVAYNMPASVLIEGALDRAALDRAIATVVARHEALRTTFVVIAGDPRQRVSADARPRVEFVDMSGAADPDGDAATLVTREAARPFDLEHGPLVRTLLVQLAPDRHVFLFNTHHIVSDDWSCGVIIREVIRAYGGAPLPALRLQYRAYERWHQRFLETDAGADDRAWWLERLGGELPTLDLPADFSRPLVKTYTGDEVPLVFEERELRALTALATAHGSTVFMALVAIVNVLLHRYTGQQDLIVVTPIAGRDHPDLEDQVGCYVNTLPLRNFVNPTMRFSDFLADVTRNTTQVLDRQRYPFDRLVDELEVRRDPGRMPVSDVVIVMQNAGAPAFALPGLSVRPFVYQGRVSKYDMHFFFEEHAGRLHGALVYNPDLFRRDRIERMRAHFATLLAAVIGDPSLRIEDLDILPADERRRLLVDFNPRPAAQSAATTLADWFAATAERAGDRTALTVDGRHMSYAELDAAANRLAHVLTANGVGPDILVGLAAGRTLETIVGMLAIVKAGGAYVPVDVTYPAERIAFMVRDAGLQVIVGGREALESLAALAIEKIAVEGVMTSAENPGRPPVALLASHLAYVIYTSGSTGQPKGVMITHRNVTRLFEATQDHFEFGSGDVWTLFHSIAFDFSVWEIWGALLYGGRLVVVPYWTTRSPEDFVALVESERVTVLNQTPSAFRAFEDADAARGLGATSSLRYVIFGGEALDVPSLAPWFDRHGEESPQLINMYGITETTVHVTHRRIRRADTLDRRSVIGRPIADLRIHVMDHLGHPAPIGLRGEMWIGGEGVAQAYLNRPELTAERFVPDPFEPGGVLYRSGDAAHYLADGDLEYLGRIDQQVKIRGHRIEPGEIQAALESHPDVRQSLVVTRPRRGEHRLVAYVTGTAEVSSGALRDFVRSRLPEYMVPESVVCLEAFPLTSNGKIDRRALRDPDNGHLETLAPVEPVGDLERLLSGIFTDVLQVDRVSVEDNFFDLGAHSLLLVRAHATLQEKHGARVPLVSFYQFPTIRRLAAHLGDDGSTPAVDAGSEADARAARRRASRRSGDAIGGRT